MSNAELPLSFRRMSPLGRGAIDGIVVDPGSSGHMQLPGRYSSESSPPAYGWKIGPRGDAGVKAQAVHVGTFNDYVVEVTIQNFRDTESTVTLFWAGSG